MPRTLIAILLIAPLWAPDAWSLPPDKPPHIEVFISGSSALEESLENLMRLKSGLEGSPNICQEGSLDVYRGTIDGVRKRVYYCLTSANVEGLPANRRLAVHKSSGGSSEGVRKLAADEEVAFIDLKNLPADEACMTPSRVLYTRSLAAYSSRRNCDGNGKMAVPDFGFSDIEPALLGEDWTGLQLQSKSQIVWGLPVSKNFRNALQAVQGLVAAEIAHDAAIRETEENMPSLTRAQLAAIFSGDLNNLNQIYDREGNPIYLSSELPLSRPERPELSGTSPGAYQPSPESGRQIYICRRSASSGTQAAYEIHYLRRRCVPDAAHFVAADIGSEDGDVDSLLRRSNPAGRVFAGKDTESVRSCLDAHDDFNRWAIGIFSTQNLGNNSSNEFRHIKVDGYSPTLINAHRGLWSHVSEPSLQWRSTSRRTSETNEAGRTLQFIRQNVGNPNVLRSLNAGFRHPWGDGGYLALSDDMWPGIPVSAKSLSEYPVAGTKRKNRSMAACHTPISAGPSAADAY